MGITKQDVTFLFHAKGKGVDFSSTAMLGRLVLYADKSDLEYCESKYKNTTKSISQVVFKDKYSEPFFEMLGANRVDSIDYSDYEQASIIHDLNKPMPDTMRQKFSCIVDGGTIEHVFNYPIAVKSCMDAIQVGGHFVGITPTNNQTGHGFYQFSPELIFRVFSEENGFEVVQMLVSADVTDGEEQEWYEVADPMKVKSRVMLVNNRPLTLRFIAKKVAQKEVFQTAPQQSDYATTWNRHEAVTTNDSSKSGGVLGLLVKKFVPYRLKVIARNLKNLATKEVIQSATLGNIDPSQFRKVDI
ncbi:MAG: hypothetical protein ACKO0X_01375 [Bacteroidota bacterium]